MIVAELRKLLAASKAALAAAQATVKMVDDPDWEPSSRADTGGTSDPPESAPQVWICDGEKVSDLFAALGAMAKAALIAVARMKHRRYGKPQALVRIVRVCNHNAIGAMEKLLDRGPRNVLRKVETLLNNQIPHAIERTEFYRDALGVLGTDKPHHQHPEPALSDYEVKS